MSRNSQTQQRERARDEDARGSRVAGAKERITDIREFGSHEWNKILKYSFIRDMFIATTLILSFGFILTLVFGTFLPFLFQCASIINELCIP